MRNVVAVASGKGGVGKSTVAVNLAVALANPRAGAPRKVALVDVDFYGPSVPTMMGGGSLQVDADEKFIPAQRYGVKYISIAFFLKNPDDPIVWRGPMFGKAINQLFQDVNWGDVDICVVDMPPGTGDAQLSLSQTVNLDGALMVTTPQEVALSDVRRAVNMFGKVNVKVLGVVENMSGFVSPSGETFDIFGSGGGEELSSKFNIPLLAKIPLIIDVRTGGDRGEPAALYQDTVAGRIFQDLAERVALLLEQGKGAEPQLRVIN